MVVVLRDVVKFGVLALDRPSLRGVWGDRQVVRARGYVGCGQQERALGRGERDAHGVVVLAAPYGLVVGPVIVSSVSHQASGGGGSQQNRACFVVEVYPA